MYPLLAINLGLHWRNGRNKRRTKRRQHLHQIQADNHARDCEMFEMIRRRDAAQALPVFDLWDDNISSMSAMMGSRSQSAAASGALGAEAYFVDLLGDDGYEAAFGGRDW